VNKLKTSKPTDDFGEYRKQDAGKGVALNMFTDIIAGLRNKVDAIDVFYVIMFAIALAGLYLVLINS